MTVIKFNIEYKTQWGEALFISGSVPQLGNLNDNDALLLSTSDGIHWNGEIELESIYEQPLEYYYFVRNNELLLTKESTPNRMVMLSDDSEFIIKDHWKQEIEHTYLFTSVFTECVFKQSLKTNAPPTFTHSIILNVICPYVKKTEHVVITGQDDILGNWEINNALPLSPIRFGEWQIELNATDIMSGISYKFAILDNNDSLKFHLEEGENRILRFDYSDQKKNTANIEMGIPYRYSSFQWKGKGVSIPLFSLRSENSAGIGDFLDLKKMVDWAAMTDQDMIQILPINDTNSSATWNDSYPYSSISIFALNPIYISINQYTISSVQKLNSFRSQAKELNDLAKIDYEKVYSLKYDFLRELFAEDGEQVMLSDEYLNFYAKNEDWLFPYVCFCHLRDKYKTADLRNWDIYSIYSRDALERMLRTEEHSKKETDFYAYIQFIAHTQMSDSKYYAQEKGIALKGDIPIGINRNSVEAWTDPHLFNMEMQAGAPPDDFSISGQNWGFPTYNWDEMERDNFEWWKKRFRKMADYFDAYRIDHILGFFRIWEMSSHHIQGLLGHFSPALPMSGEELYVWGFPFDEQRMAQPYIHENMLQDFFGEYVNEATVDYLDVISWQRFQLKPFCNTQQKINQLFANRDDDKSNILRNGLFGLCTEVLFVPDPYSQNLFHPRILAQHTYSFMHLSDHEKEIYNRIYDAFFYKRHNQFWYEQAMRKLPQLISSTSMLVCGEDLGMVPDCVNWVMDELQILSLEIQRMPKQSNILFSDLNKLPYLSVNTTSTHDMSTIRGWWTENIDNTQYYYNNILGREGEAPQECSAQICEQIIRLHLDSNSMWSILPWQDWMSMDDVLRRDNPEEERINVPSNPYNNWNYRMHITLEVLLNKEAFNNRIKQMVR